MYVNFKRPPDAYQKQIVTASSGLLLIASDVHLVVSYGNMRFYEIRSAIAVSDASSGHDVPLLSLMYIL